MGPLIKIILSALIINSSAACSQTNSKNKFEMETDNADAQKLKIIDVTRQLTQLMIDKDTMGMNNILDPHFTLTHITGYVQSKDEWLSEITSERMKYYSYKEFMTSVEINGSRATFTGQNVLNARIWGSRNNWRLQQTMQLEYRNGNWIILKSVATTF